MERWLNRVAIVAAAFYFARGTVSLLPGGGMNLLDWLKADILELIVPIIGIVINCLAAYLPLKGLAIILKILMQMEFSSRGIGLKPKPVEPEG